MKPTTKPANPNFSSGPTSKRPGWSVDQLDLKILGRSHRAKEPKARIQKISDDSRQLLGIPEDYLLGLVPASDTGAFEMAMWTMLGARPVDVFSWESFGNGWVNDITKQLKLENTKLYNAEYGNLPNLSIANPEHDIVFTWNGTTSGVRVPNDEWISEHRKGLTLCDATSAAFAMHLPWRKLDVITWSWQKVLGGEGGHGMLALSPRAVARLEQWQPDRPLPKIFRLTKSGLVNKEIFSGATINTPSLLAVEDHLDALKWAKDLGLEKLIKRSLDNLDAIASWINQSSWISFLAEDETIRSSTSICMKIVDPWFAAKTTAMQRDIIKQLVSLLESESVAYDIGGYRDAPPGLRIWGGGTVETRDIKLLTPWLDWGWLKVKNN
ncbi:MAG: phosphoserine transaminase [Candidatus Azotimanducaceae bacterium]|uniref:phosphoserine transaminase n=1 Tax=OM182 bacterium TaxID=2510334 RepID=A0A520S0E7_9GAMM|nr:phosphoserine transaminase [Gammaproteobacteria bacterium]OUV67917.1 MAG: phosphoserine aminotransferase [Gammaproteobacteria bacterium TMED133]RZO75940.1 MAG: phosphoserine transaminase [OM182 bacterium]